MPGCAKQDDYLNQLSAFRCEYTLGIGGATRSPVSCATRPVPPYGTKVEFTALRRARNLAIEQYLGEGCSGVSNSKEFGALFILAPSLA
jgi:hypothetical protein